ncbi:MAG: hypothetical protein M0C28_00650 [Candidatus Moduliflexus flocculans]|nr:hypothetical protein [Candidatus Moduliflexus flocculans]
MGVGLLAVALIILAGQLDWFPVGREAIGLAGWKLAVAVTVSFAFGALQTIGVGFYAPCMATIYALGMHPQDGLPDHDDGHGHADGRGERPVRQGKGLRPEGRRRPDPGRDLRRVPGRFRGEVPALDRDEMGRAGRRSCTRRR